MKCSQVTFVFPLENRETALSTIEPLTREEQVILLGAQPRVLPEDQEALESLLRRGVVWRGVLSLAKRNRAGPLLHRYIKNMPAGIVPQQVQRQLHQSFLETYQRNLAFQELASRIQSRLDDAGMKGVFLRGLSLAEIEYGNPALRRFSDIDLLVPWDDVPRALEVLTHAGGTHRREALSDSYYFRHHFHVERIFGEGIGAMVELHWNLDHHYTMYTIDIDGLVHRARRVRVGSIELTIPDSVDRFIGLCLHASKHCPAIRYYPRAPLLPRRVLLDGWLIQVVDLAMSLHASPSIDWGLISAKAREWGAENTVFFSLVALRTILGVSAPQQALEHLSPRARHNKLETALTRRFLDPGHTLQLGRRMGKIEQWILKRWNMQEDAVFHPVRLLDLANYFFPEKRDLARWFARPNVRPYLFWWLRHALAGAWRLTTGAIALLSYRFKRKLQRQHGIPMKDPAE